MRNFGVGTLYLVATPIGNLADLSPRAASVLSGVDHVLAEDTRRTRTLTESVGARRALIPFHAHNEWARAKRVLGWLTEGQSVALVSDAGTPLLSDPGAGLVQAAASAGHRIVPVPGPSAVLAALVSSGLAAERFSFLGFPPRKGTARERMLERVRASGEPTVLFESPRRLPRLLEDLSVKCGPTRQVSVARELTKLHEDIRRGGAAKLAAHYRRQPPRGEVTLVVAPLLKAALRDDTSTDRVGDAARIAARTMLAEGLAPSTVARVVSATFGVPRNAAYRLVHAGDGTGKQ